MWVRGKDNVLYAPEPQMGAVKPQYGRWQNVVLYLHVSPVFLSMHFFYLLTWICGCVCACVCVCVCVCVCRRRMEKRRIHWRPRRLWSWSLWTIQISKTRSTTLQVRSRFPQTYTKAVSVQKYFFSFVFGGKMRVYMQKWDIKKVTPITVTSRPSPRFFMDPILCII